jgi:hypothetical protein
MTATCRGEADPLGRADVPARMARCPLEQVIGPWW